MAWFAANWFWVLILIAFIAMHKFGFGCHAGHSGHGDHQGSRDEREKDETQGRDVNKSSGGHQH